MEVITQTLTQVFRQVFNAPKLELNRNMTANDVEDWTSQTHMKMIWEVEKAFGVKIKLSELNKLQNVGDLIDLLAAKKGA